MLPTQHEVKPFIYTTSIDFVSKAEYLFMEKPFSCSKNTAPLLTPTWVTHVHDKIILACAPLERGVLVTEINSSLLRWKIRSVSWWKAGCHESSDDDLLRFVENTTCNWNTWVFWISFSSFRIKQSGQEAWNRSFNPSFITKKCCICRHHGFPNSPWFA